MCTRNVRFFFFSISERSWRMSLPRSCPLAHPLCKYLKSFFKWQLCVLGRNLLGGQPHAPLDLHLKYMWLNTLWFDYFPLQKYQNSSSGSPRWPLCPRPDSCLFGWFSCPLSPSSSNSLDNFPNLPFNLDFKTASTSLSWFPWKEHPRFQTQGLWRLTTAGLVTSLQALHSDMAAQDPQTETSIHKYRILEQASF